MTSVDVLTIKIDACYVSSISVENWNQCSKINCEAFSITSMHHQTLKTKKDYKNDHKIFKFFKFLQ